MKDRRPKGPALNTGNAAQTGNALPVVVQPGETGRGGTATTTNGASTAADDDASWLLREEQKTQLSEDSPTVCLERWKNAGPEARKKMFSLFSVTGIFIVVCRHGHVLVMCDMVRSGEL